MVHGTGAVIAGAARRCARAGGGCAGAGCRRSGAGERSPESACLQASQ